MPSVGILQVNPARDKHDQIQKIFDVIGIPEKAELEEALQSSAARNYVQSMTQRTGIGLRSRFLDSDVPEDALDLLSNMLVFDHKKRFSVDDCLQHRVFSELRLLDAASQVDYSPVALPGRGAFPRPGSGSSMKTKKMKLPFDKEIDMAKRDRNWEKVVALILQSAFDAELGAWRERSRLSRRYSVHASPEQSWY